VVGGRFAVTGYREPVTGNWGTAVRAGGERGLEGFEDALEALFGVVGDGLDGFVEVDIAEVFGVDVVYRGHGGVLGQEWGEWLAFMNKVDTIFGLAMGWGRWGRLPGSGGREPGDVKGKRQRRGAGWAERWVEWLGWVLLTFTFTCTFTFTLKERWVHSVACGVARGLFAPIPDSPFPIPGPRFVGVG